MIDSPITQAITMQSIVGVSTSDTDGTGFACASKVVTALHALKQKGDVYVGTVTFYDWKTKKVKTQESEFIKAGEDIAISKDKTHKLQGLKSIQNIPSNVVSIGMKLTVFGPQGNHAAGEVMRLEGDKLHYSASTQPGWSGCPVMCNGKIFVHCGTTGVGSNYAYALNLSAPGGSPSGRTPAL